MTRWLIVARLLGMRVTGPSDDGVILVRMPWWLTERSMPKVMARLDRVRHEAELAGKPVTIRRAGKLVRVEPRP